MVSRSRPTYIARHSTPAPAPTISQQPASRLHPWSRPPTRVQGERTERIRVARRNQCVLARVVTQIDACAADLGGRGQNTGVIAVREHAAFAAHHAIERAGDADAETLHTARKRALVRHLHDQMDVVAE